MKYLIITCALLSFLSSCKEIEPPKPKSSLTTIEGRYTLVNSDEPIPNVYVYIYTGVFPFQSKVIDWCYTDSNGYYKLTFDKEYTNAKFNDDLDGLTYLYSRHKGDIFNELTFLPDGSFHRRDFELVPPAWVNVRMVDKGKFTDYHEVNVSSERYPGGGWNIYGPKDSTILVKVQGNMQDTISFGYWYYNGNNTPPFNLLKSLKFPVFVPPFQVQEMTIEY